MLKNSRAWKRMTRKSGVGLRRAVHYLAEEDEDEQVSRESLGLAVRRRNSVDVRLRSSRESDAEEHVSRDRESGKQRGPRVEKFKRPGGENIRNYGQQIMSVRTFEGFARKSHLAGCRREKTSGVGITHHPGWERLVHWEG